MKNLFGVQLDKNGYAPSLMGWTDRCMLCGRMDRPLNRHEVYHGPYRTLSKNLGCWMEICDVCHDKIHHKGGVLDRSAKTIMQNVAMEKYGWSVEDFRKYFGKSYV